jgi:squalene cyclase
MGQATDALKDGRGQAGAEAGLSDALRAGRRRLWRDQAADGSWAAACDLGPASTAYVVTTLAYLGKLTPETGRAASAFLLAQQDPRDGSIPGRPFTREGDVGATAALWAALWAAGAAENADAIRRARDYVENHGGHTTLVRLFYEGDPAAVFLAMAGLLPAKPLAEITPSLLMNTAPGASYFTRNVSVILPWRGLVFGVILRSLDNGDKGGIARRIADDLLRNRERELCLASLDRTRNADGSWLYGDTLQTSLALAALHAMGLQHDPRSTEALAWLDKQKQLDKASGQVRYPIFQSDVWTTAFDLRALVNSGARPSRLGLLRATRWLLDCQHDGSWAFQEHNTAMPDSDDVGVVLASLSEARDYGKSAQAWRSLDARITTATSAAVSWLRGMQNPDGGWPSFQKGLPGKPPGPIMTRPFSMQSPWEKLRLALDPPPDAGDPATEDVTGRVLYGLGKYGLRVGDPAVDRGIAFVREQQCLSGGWWGRWVVNYLAATSWVLRGCAAVGVPASETFIRRGVDFIRAHQREDGGWGESVASYSDPLSAGEGNESTPGLTGLVLSALCEVGEGSSPQAARAAAYLRRTQLPDGGWPNGDLVHCLIPPTLYYVLPGAELQLPLEGLGRYAAANRLDGGEIEDPTQGGGPPARRTIADFRKRLEVAKFESDDKADAAVVAVKRAGLPHVAPIIATMTRNRDLVPSGLPEPLAAMFEDTALPPWADKVRMQRAQQLFERCGWAAALSLFASSLPQCYACADGAKILIHTEELRKNPQRRILETSQFVFDVTAQGAFAENANSRGLRSAQKVRLLHALVRSLVKDKVDIANPKAGEPISQFYLVGTLMTFSAVVVDGMRTMELEVSDEDADAWVHLWNVVGWFMGIREDLLPIDAREAESLLEAVREMSWAPSEAGNLLAKATLGVMQEHLLPGTAFDGVAVMLVRHLAGDRCADLLGLPPANWTNVLFGPFKEAMDLFEVNGTSPLAALLRKASMTLMLGLQKAYLGKDRPEFETLETKRLLQMWQESVKSK